MIGCLFWAHTCLRAEQCLRSSCQYGRGTEKQFCIYKKVLMHKICISNWIVVLWVEVEGLTILKDLLFAREDAREKLDSVVLVFKLESPHVLLLGAKIFIYIMELNYLLIVLPTSKISKYYGTIDIFKVYISI